MQQVISHHSGTEEQAESNSVMLSTHVLENMCHSTYVLPATLWLLSWLKTAVTSQNGLIGSTDVRICGSLVKTSGVFDI